MWIDPEVLSLAWVLMLFIEKCDWSLAVLWFIILKWRL